MTAVLEPNRPSCFDDNRQHHRDREVHGETLLSSLDTRCGLHSHHACGNMRLRRNHVTDETSDSELRQELAKEGPAFAWIPKDASDPRYDAAKANNLIACQNNPLQQWTTKVGMSTAIAMDG